MTDSRSVLFNIWMRCGRSRTFCGLITEHHHPWWPQGAFQKGKVAALGLILVFGWSVDVGDQEIYVKVIAMFWPTVRNTRLNIFIFSDLWWHHKCLGSQWRTVSYHHDNWGDGKGTRVLHNWVYSCTHLIKKMWGQINHTILSLGWKPLVKYGAYRNRPW